MGYKIVIYKDNKFYKEENLKQNWENFIYKWGNVESGSYFFEIKNEETDVISGVTYSHTAPFAKRFEAVVDENLPPKSITGFQKGIDIYVEYCPSKRTISLTKMKFYRMNLNIADFGLEKADKVEIAGNFNNWKPDTEPIHHFEGTNYEVILASPEGVYEYKYLIDGKWYPENENKKLIIGENGALFPQGDLGTGKFVYEAIDKNTNLKAIVHNYDSLQYFNKLSDNEYEFKIRTQMNDVERAYISVVLHEEDNYEMIYELERYQDKTNGFDYFERIINFGKEAKKLLYYFILEDNGSRAYFNGKTLSYSKPKRLIVNTTSKDIQLFDVPNWAKEAIWYNIFPDRFYNGNHYNDPIFNEFGPEAFKPNRLHEQNFIEDYKWEKSNNVISQFDRNRWTADFREQVVWEKLGEREIDYSLKYARMYGGDLQGIKEKIPYMKELGINAVWLNPVFFSYQNHKYGANDFRHISPDFGTIKTSGKTHDVEINKNNKYGNKSYVDVLGNKASTSSELKLLEVNLNGENRGKNGYGETEDPSTWVWTESDLIMVDLIKEFHKNGIRVIFDGVFNHSSSEHWTFNMVLADGENSKYKDWYKFTDFGQHVPITDEMSKEQAYETLIANRKRTIYNAWGGFDSLPEFNSFNQEYKEYIFNITRKWMYGPDGKESENWMEDDGIDGWRLDVPNCLENQNFWNEWREVVKGSKTDSYITAELWGNAAGDINGGNKFDTVMNYEWLKTVIGFFINQSREGGVRYKLKAQDFFNELREKRTWYPYQALQASQNLNGSHDTDRLYSRIVNDVIGRNLEEGKQLEKGYNGIRPDLASNYHPNTTIDWRNSPIKPKDILKLISVFQMTYIGAPMLFYGDEVGMWGATDPYCRKPMLWKEFMYDDEKNPSHINQNEVYQQKVDSDLFEWYKKLIRIRLENKTLVYGKFREIFADNDREIIVYERVIEDHTIIVIINNSFNSWENVEFETNYQDERFIDLVTEGRTFRTSSTGKIKLSLKAKEGMILRKVRIDGDYE
ncbi:alpha amylase N-terminal ig-like domain-containing protein [Leptotrichia sp. oral taxon 223]|uniref:alpha amylase N-terminal ig-like domain-containing protein n=1 Tax=Leptotrichia sp. oral taxon 223 TaxID=712363 RepID=UPI0015C15232|nr:alpha amylase N-terminal ig-like domain-containing protein [Leptotrichia sp. oral taxon 223]NWO19104.1 alpha amylase N-terminal ig-like domain-containing protein [Leptotrichia sp. oral taxon 223]